MLLPTTVLGVASKLFVFDTIFDLLQDSMVERGIILLSMKNYDESLKVFKEALRLREKEVKIARTSERTREAELKIAKIRHNIGCVNFEIGNLDDAEEAFNEAIAAQISAFGSWVAPFMMLTDTTKPGFLTMASTMCNRGTSPIWVARFAFSFISQFWLS
jgi:tetratricopeptide (TPR) repeat protein